MIAQGLRIRSEKAGLSFYKQTRYDFVFICFVYNSPGSLQIWLRSDLLQSRFDFQSVAQVIQESLSTDVRINTFTSTWFILLLPSTKVESGRQTADLILQQVVSRIEIVGYSYQSSVVITRRCIAIVLAMLINMRSAAKLCNLAVKSILQIPCRLNLHQMICRKQFSVWLVVISFVTVVTNVQHVVGHVRLRTHYVPDS